MGVRGSSPVEHGDGGAGVLSGDAVDSDLWPGFGVGSGADDIPIASIAVVSNTGTDAMGGALKMSSMTVGGW